MDVDDEGSRLAFTFVHDLGCFAVIGTESNVPQPVLPCFTSSKDCIPFEDFLILSTSSSLRTISTPSILTHPSTDNEPSRPTKVTVFERSRSPSIDVGLEISMVTPETFPNDVHTPLIQENDGSGGVWDGHEKDGQTSKLTSHGSER